MLPQASIQAPRVDAIFFSLVAASAVVVLLLFGLIVGFSLVYRRGSKAERKPLATLVSREIEISWTVATLFAFLFAFWWAASAQLGGLIPPANAIEVHVVAKQWMWKFEHDNGVREISDLHIPAGVPVRLVMISQDVIHSFYVPDFRVKQDVLPGRYTQMWFQARTPGTYRLACAEFCGTDHASMTGRVIVMTPADFARWAAEQPAGPDLAARGRLLFTRLGCSGCHIDNNVVRAPPLGGVAGEMITLSSGAHVRADDAYLRDSILLPNRDVAAGYAAEMPSYQGVASEEDVNALVAYLRSTGPEEHTR